MMADREIHNAARGRQTSRIRAASLVLKIGENTDWMILQLGPPTRMFLADWFVPQPTGPPASAFVNLGFCLDRR